MPIFNYSGLDAGREAIKGSVLADSARHAREILRDRGVVVHGVKEQKLNWRNLPRFFRLGQQRAANQWGLGAHELSMLLAAGIPLADALQTLATQHRGPFRSAILRVQESVEGGSSLAAAMDAQPDVFDPASVRLIEVGENAGNLEHVLSEVAEFKLQFSEFKDKIQTALLYPVFLACFGLAAMVFLMTWVMPPLLESLQETLPVLPWPTRIAKAISDLLLSYGYWLAAGGVTLFIGFAAWSRSTQGRLSLDHAMLATPLLGPLLLKQAIARAAMIVALLTRGGVMLTTAVNLAAKSTSNSVVSKVLLQAEKDMTAGEDIATSLERSGRFPLLAIRFFAVGQDSGQLDHMLARLAKDYNTQVAKSASRVTALVEPVLIIVLAAAVGFLLLATILPILEAGNVS